MLFKSRTKITRPNRYYPGIYEISFPFMGYSQDIGICEVEIHVAQGLSNGSNILITVIVKSSKNSSPPVRHFIADICTKIRYCYFDKLVNEKLSADVMVEESRIRWIEIIPYAQGKNVINQVTMTWDPVKKHYNDDPVWVENIEL